MADCHNTATSETVAEIERRNQQTQFRKLQEEQLPHHKPALYDPATGGDKGISGADHRLGRKPPQPCTDTNIATVTTQPSIAEVQEIHTLRQQIQLLETKHAAILNRNYQIEEDNKHKAILYTTTLQEIHQLTEENRELRRQVEDLHTQLRAQLDLHTTEEKSLWNQLEDSTHKNAAALEQIAAEKHQLTKENRQLHTNRNAETHSTEITRSENHRLRQLIEDLQAQQAAALLHNKKILADKDNLQHTLTLLQNQNTAEVERKKCDDHQIKKLQEENAFL